VLLQTPELFHATIFWNAVSDITKRRELDAVHCACYTDFLESYYKYLQLRHLVSTFEIWIYLTGSWELKVPKFNIR
jgi:hypothetical protein